MSRPNDAHDAERRRLLTGALLTANLKYPGDVVGWVDGENAKMEKEGTPKSELLPVLQRDAVKKFANGSRPSSKRVAAVVDAFISKYNSREQRAAARALSSAPAPEEEDDDDDGLDDDGLGDGSGSAAAELPQQAQKKRKIGFTITITAGSSSGLTWDASGCDVERAREIVMHDLLGKMPQHGEVRGVLGGKHGRKYMCLGSTGGSSRRSRARARASMLQAVATCGSLHASHTGGDLSGSLKFLAASRAAHTAGVRIACKEPVMQVDTLLRAVGGSTRRCLRVKRELRKYGFRVGGSETTLRQKLSSRRCQVHGERVTINDSATGGVDMHTGTGTGAPVNKSDVLDIVRRVDVCAVARDHVAAHMDAGAFIDMQDKDKVHMTICYDAGANVEKVGLVLSNTFKAQSEHNCAPLAFMQNGNVTKCDHLQECKKMWGDPVAADIFKRSLKQGCQELHGATFVTVSDPDGGPDAHACLANVPHMPISGVPMESPGSGSGRAWLPGHGYCNDTQVFINVPRARPTGWVPVSTNGMVEKWVCVSGWHGVQSYGASHPQRAQHCEGTSLWEQIWTTHWELLAAYIDTGDKKMMRRCTQVNQWSLFNLGMQSAGATEFATICAIAELTRPIPGGAMQMEQRTVACKLISDCPASQQGAGMLEGGVCPCHLCTASKNEWQNGPRDGETPRDKHEIEHLFGQHNGDTGTFDSRMHKSQIRLPYLPDIPFAPPVLHIFLGVGNGLTDFYRVAARYLDDNIDYSREESKECKKEYKLAKLALVDAERTDGAAAARAGAYLDTCSVANGRQETHNLLTSRITRQHRHYDAATEYREILEDGKKAKKELEDAKKRVSDAAAAVGGTGTGWRAGRTELAVADVLENTLGAVSQGFHGGSFNGPALRRVFWGFERGGEDYNWKEVVQVLEDELAGRDDERAATVRTHLYTYIVPMSRALDTASKYMLSTLFNRPKQEMEEGAKACKLFVGLWRECARKRDNGKSLFKEHYNVGWTTKLKHHLMESHVVDFVEDHGSAGAFSESAIESFHRLFNSMQHVWVSIPNALQRWRIMIDRAAVDAEAGAIASGAERRKQAKNGTGRTHKKA